MNTQEKLFLRQAWQELGDGHIVPSFIERGRIGRRRALRMPNGTLYTLHKGIWVHYMPGLGERWERNP